MLHLLRSIVLGGFGEQHARHEQGDIPPAVEEAVQEDAAFDEDADRSAAAREPQDYQEEHHGATELDGDGPEVRIIPAFEVDIPGPDVQKRVTQEAEIHGRIVHEAGLIALLGQGEHAGPLTEVGEEGGHDAGQEEAHGTAEGQRCEGLHQVSMRLLADEDDAALGEDVARDDEEDGNHRGAAEEDADEGQLQHTPVVSLAIS